MKDIMAKESSDSEQGIATFEYNPADGQQSFLCEFSRPLDDLGDMLLREYAGQELTMYEIYEQHSVDRPYIKKNYKKILLQLEEQGRITASKHRRNSFPDTVIVNFSDQERNRL